MEEWLTKIKVSFYLYGDEFNTDIITNKIMIKPTKVRTKEEFPEVSKKMGFAHTSWKLETKNEVSRSINLVMNKLISQLKEKEIGIKELCDEFNLEASFTIIINIINDDMPELVLSKENIAFMASINAEVGFDIYNN